VWNDRINNKRWIGWDLEGSGRGRFDGNIATLDLMA
jgi:hypothetical protein